MSHLPTPNTSHLEISFTKPSQTKYHEQLQLLLKNDPDSSNLVNKEIVKNIANLVPNNSRLLISANSPNHFSSNLVKSQSSNATSTNSHSSIQSSNQNQQNFLHEVQQKISISNPIPISNFPNKLPPRQNKTTPRGKSCSKVTSKLAERDDDNKENLRGRGRSQEKNTRFKRIVGRARSATRVLGKSKTAATHPTTSQNKTPEIGSILNAFTTSTGLVFNKPINSNTVSIVNALCKYISCFCKTEGLFRKTGNKNRQKMLKQAIDKGLEIIESITETEFQSTHLDDPSLTCSNFEKFYQPKEATVGCYYLVHDACNVLKELLRSIPDGILISSDLSHSQSNLKIIAEDIETNHPDFSLNLIQSLLVEGFFRRNFLLQSKINLRKVGAKSHITNLEKFLKKSPILNSLIPNLY